MTDTLNKTIYMKASKEDVWAFLTDPEKLALWFHKPKGALADGKDYAIYGTTSGDKLMWGTVNVANPHDYLEYSFTITPMGDATSTVKWTLEAVDGGTRLSLAHEGLPAGEDAFGLTVALDNGWDKHFADLRGALHGAD